MIQILILHFAVILRIMCFFIIIKVTRSSLETGWGGVWKQAAAPAFLAVWFYVIIYSERAILGVFKHAKKQLFV